MTLLFKFLKFLSLNLEVNKFVSSRLKSLEFEWKIQLIFTLKQQLNTVNLLNIYSNEIIREIYYNIKISL